MQRVLVAAGVLGMILGTSAGQEPIRRVAPAQQPQDAWMLEIDYGEYVRHGDMQRHNRFFIQPRPLDLENRPEGSKLNQWFVSWEGNGAGNFLIRFYLVPQGFAGPPTPEMLDRVEKTLLREFEIRPQEQVFLTELKQYGFHPVAIRLARPVTDQMPLPYVVIETPSLQLAGLAPVRNQLELKLVNRSSSAVMAIGFGDGPCPQSIHASIHRPLIAAGGEGTISCRVGPQAAGGTPYVGEIVVESAFFQDYRYEGDVRFARQELARLCGVRQGLPMLIEAIRKALQQDRDQEVGPVLASLLEKLNPEKIQIEEGLAEEFAELDGDPGRRDEWLQRLHMAARTVHRMFAREMEWNTRRLIDTGGPRERFWRMLESREERLSEWLARLEGNPPGALY